MSKAKAEEPSAGNAITSDEATNVGGGTECTVSELVRLSDQFTLAYENLVDFTSHVIERVSNGLTN